MNEMGQGLAHIEGHAFKTHGIKYLPSIGADLVPILSPISPEPQIERQHRQHNAMSALEARKDGSEVLYLNPQDIVIDSKYDVRLYPDSPDDTEAVEKLAETIERDGQLDSGIVFPRKRTNPDDPEVDEEEYVLIAGSRRLRAITLINQRNSASAKSLLLMRVVVDRTGGDQLRKAIVSNLHRQDFSPMDLATLISRILADNGWESTGFKGTKKVSEYLGISPSSVLNHQKFLTADAEVKQKLASRQISAESALLLLKEENHFIRAAALKIAEESSVKKQKGTGAGGKSRVPQIQVPGSKSASGDTKAAESTADKALTKPRIQRPEIVKALKAVGSETKAIPPARKEIVEFFAQFDGPAYGYLDSAVRQFSQYFKEKYAVGKGTEKTLTAKFDAMTAKSSKGTKQSEPEPPAPKAKAKEAKPKAKAEKAVKKSAKKSRKKAAAVESAPESVVATA